MDEEEQPCKKLKTLLGLPGHDDFDTDEEEENNTLSKYKHKVQRRVQEWMKDVTEKVASIPRKGVTTCATSSKVIF